MEIKRFHNFLNEDIVYYDKIKIDTVDDEFNTEMAKFDILKKYFPYQKATGIDDWNTGKLNATFDNGMSLKGQYDSENDVMPTVLTINNHSYNFNFHPRKGLSGVSLSNFEKQIRHIHKMKSAVDEIENLK